MSYQPVSPQVKTAMLVAVQNVTQRMHVCVNELASELNKVSPVVAHGMGKTLENLRKRIDRMKQEIEAIPL